MTIEVRQLIIKSTVQSEQASLVSEREAVGELAMFKEELLNECRELVAESLREHAER